MIENLRKYPGVIIAALVAVFVGFLLMDSQQFFRSSGANSISVNGVSYDANAYQRLGPSSRSVAGQMISYQSMEMLGFLQALSDSKATSEDGADKSFFVNRLLLQKAGREFGIQPGMEEIQAFLRERSVFVQTDPTDPSSKNFNQEGYDGFIKQGLGRFGMSEPDLFAIIGDFLIYEKLSALLGSSIEVNPEDVKQTYQVRQQKISASYISLKLDDYKAKQQLTEEQLKEFWELRKDKYKTEVRRKFSYVLGTPKYPAGAEKAPEPPKPAKPGDPIPEPTEADKKIIEDRRLADFAVDELMDTFLEKIENSKGADFEAAAKEAGLEIKTTEFFTASTVPDVLLALTPRKNTKTITDFLFNFKTTSDPISKFTATFAVGEADSFMARLDEEEPSRDKTYEEAKEEVTKQWIEENALAALKTAAEEAKKKIEETMNNGKSFADAAKEAGYETTTLGPIGNGETPAGHSSAPAIFTAAQYLNPGSLTDVITTDAAAVIAIVDKREIYKDPNAEFAVMGGVSQMKNQMGILAFQAWIAEQNAMAKVSQ